MTTTHHPRKSTFIDVRSLVFWIGLGLAVYGALHIYPLVVREVSQSAFATALSALLWAVYGIVFLVILYRLEVFEHRSPMTMVGAFLWGAIVANGVTIAAGVPINDMVGKLLGPDLQDWVSAIAAPLVEEPLKMLGIVALAFIPGARITSTLDGLFYGLVIGLGFEVTESFMYSANAGIDGGSVVAAVVGTLIIRGVVGGLWSHPTYTAITGAGVGYFFTSGASALKRWLVMLGALAASMVLHGIFDSPLLEFGNPILSSVLKGLPVLVLLIVVLRVARKKERAIFTGVAESDVPSDLVSVEELETLLTRHDRKKARKPLRKEHGLAASHAMKRLQRAQIELISAIGDTGPDSEESNAWAAEVREDRRVLAQVTV